MDNISRYEAEARKLGISYGQYSAMLRDRQMEVAALEEKTRQETKTRREKKQALLVPLCIACNKPFYQKGREKTCSPECRAELKRIRDREYRAKLRALKVMAEGEISV